MSAYTVAKERVTDFLRKNNYKPGDKFPSEPEFSEKLGISRVALREAINAFRNEGVVRSEQGRGTFLCCRLDQMQGTLNTNPSVTKMIIDSGHAVGMCKFRKQLVEADEDIAEQLGVEPGASVVMCSRVRLADKVPVAYTEDYLAPRLTPEFLQFVPDDSFSLGDFIKNVCGIEVGVSMSELIPIVADDALAQTFNINVGAPLMLLKDYVHDAYGSPLVYAKETMMPNFFQFVVKRI
jgi:GntR family transcriptional regulator